MEVNRHYSKKGVKVVNENLKKRDGPMVKSTCYSSSKPELKSVPNGLQ